MLKKISSAALAALLLLGGCSSEKEAKKSEVAGMKCGAGKCGANMFDGNKALYDCVRNPMTGRLSLKCGSSAQEKSGGMKCGAGKCGASMSSPKKAPQKVQSPMKCDGSMKM